MARIQRALSYAERLLPEAQVMFALSDDLYPSIETNVGNPRFGRAADIYSMYTDSNDRVWAGTVLPIWVFEVTGTGAIRNPFGVERDVELVGDRGEIYSWIERTNGEVWGATYSGKNHIVRFSPSRMSVNLGAHSINRGWRPRGACTDGTSTFWSIGPKSSNGLTEYGGIIEVDASGNTTAHLDIISQDIHAMDYYDGKIYALASGEGIPGATSGVRFYCIDATTMTEDWNVSLGGTRGLSLQRLNSTQYVVVGHLTSSTIMRLQVVNINTQAREWVVTQEDVATFGRQRNCIRDWAGELWTIGDDGIYSIDLTRRRVDLRCRLPNSGIDTVSCMTTSNDLGILVACDQRVFRWDPR